VLQAEPVQRHQNPGWFQPATTISIQVGSKDGEKIDITITQQRLEQYKATGITWVLP
jgi:hypothetical protein